MNPDLRIPFEIAIAEPALLKPWFDEMSGPQQVALKAMYGCSLDGTKQDKHGWTELDHWAMTQGSCTYDELGYLTGVTAVPYTPQEYPEAWAIVGVRGGKTDRFAATITAYEATCGGHEGFTRKGRPLICFNVAQDLRMAKYSLHSIKTIIESMPFAMRQPSWILNTTADRIDLRNGVTIATTPPTVKSIRGYDSPVGVLDEIGIWYTEADSANPDFEIYRQIASRQAQFALPKIVGISSPWAKQGLLWERFLAGTNGCKIFCEHCTETVAVADCPDCKQLRLPHQGRLIIHCTSAGLGNPLIRKSWLQQQRDADVRAFERECLAQFQDSISGFLDTVKLDSAVDKGVLERSPNPKMFYVAAMDPAFRHDAFAFALGHVDPSRGVVLDVIKRWLPPLGSSLNPAEVLVEIAALLRRFRVFTIYSDQYQFESLQQLAMNLGFSIEPVDFTASSKADIYGNLKSLVNQRRLRLLDEPVTLRELKQLEAKLTQGGSVQISAPRNQHDDLATVVALVGHKSIWMLPAADAPVKPAPTNFDVIAAQVQSKQHQHFVADSDEDW